MVVGVGEVEGGEVEEAGDAGGVADELAGPIDDRVEVGAGCVRARRERIWRW